MGHRALLAYRRDDDSAGDPTYDLHRSQWGGADFALARHVSAETPFAADTAFAVDPDPIGTGLGFETVVADRLDFLGYEAFYRVDAGFEVAPFHVLWFGLESDADGVERSETVGHGALVAARPPHDDFLPGWFRGTKAAVGDAFDCGAVAREDALAYLSARVRSRAGDREVILPE
ncbi:DUF6735 family protein [Halorussus marinus]|uniref:DUF6735 family protein n=1 Tax=Halorussus marinus TaxID=2505976 RepID=UPI001091A31A|nr:DUF6735 family protein [Halorussus marinus]